MARQKLFVLVPVEVEIMTTDDEPDHVGTIRMPSDADIKRAMEECNSFMDKEDAWKALTG